MSDVDNPDDDDYFPFEGSEWALARAIERHKTPEYQAIFQKFREEILGKNSQTAPDLVHPSAAHPQDVKENDNG